MERRGEVCSGSVPVGKEVVTKLGNCASEARPDHHRNLSRLCAELRQLTERPKRGGHVACDREQPRLGLVRAERICGSRMDRPVKTMQLLAALFLLLASTALSQETIVSAKVVGIADGDTVKALVAGNELLRVRLSWIDAPEKSQAFGQRSKQHLSELVFGREVELHTHGLDRYGRTLAVVILDGVDINLEQVRSGMAWCYTRYIAEAPADIQASYRQAEAEAWEQQRGLWSERDPIPPWEWRRAAKHAPHA
jgi:endonuclease YncB( thermonuclease family)